MSSTAPSALAGPMQLRSLADATAIRSMRRRLAEHLAERQVSADLSQRALLVASELLTNALEASPEGAEISLAAEARDGRVTVTVENRCGADPEIARAFSTVAMPGALASRGRGLPLVAAVSARLSITFEPGTVRVSADLLERTDE